MEQERIKVLLSAYACNPLEGSEPAIGWRWAIEMAKNHEVTVLTRENNRTDIEAAIAALPAEEPRPDFVYFDLSERLRRWKKMRGFNQWYYLFWQRHVRGFVEELVSSREFDLLHHVTYASYRYGTALDGHGVPVLWGPVGGAERTPWKLLRLDSKRSFCSEMTRNLINAVQETPILGMLPSSARSEKVLASTKETAAKLRNHGIESTLFPTIGLDLPTELPKPRERGEGGLKVIYVGNLLFLKGLHLALEGLARVDFDFHLTVLGDGVYGDNLRAMVKRLGLVDRVTFVGRVPMDEVATYLDKSEVFLFPSLHDSGGIALLEAMAIGLPSVCLDCGGPGLAVDETCGIAVPVTTADSISKALADGLLRYASDSDLYRSHSACAITRVVERYEWGKKREQMSEVYREVVCSK